MRIIKNINVPTGNILIVEGSKGKLEMVSLGDYGKDVNLKADFLGLERKPKKVRHTKLLPLTEKWVLTLSTQYGCSIGCNFCDVPKVGKGINATYRDLIKQMLVGVQLHQEIKSTQRLNIHYARMGEPTFNPNVLDSARWAKDHLDSEYNVHPVVSTMMPKNNEWLRTFIHQWMRIKNRLYVGNAGLQLSINSTNDEERFKMFAGNACSLMDIYKVMKGVVPTGRKITLNFAVADYEVNAKELIKYFDPDDYLIKLTPMHKTSTAIKNNIKTEGDYTEYYPYSELEDKLKNAGYEVIVFIASEEEDLGRITCGNAILSGSQVDI